MGSWIQPLSEEFLYGSAEQPECFIYGQPDGVEPVKGADRSDDQHEECSHEKT